ncbi:hypothetical protein Sste5346_002109 [Sporothrix stenoceras]|uniref:EGF domain-specific O-linked N-acetylglucosamine transferase n=1 Tax=Sporothrix stenoceras TaxID=5173 RepID=A0ABR3ZJZ9_9PEZI
MLLQLGFKMRRTVPAAFAASLVLCLGYFYLSPTPHDFVREHVPGLPSWPAPGDGSPASSVPEKPEPVDHLAPFDPLNPPDLLLPAEYDVDMSSSRFCADRFSRKYLTDLRSTEFQYCNATSRSSLTCFHSHTSNDDERDSLCVAQGAVFDVDSSKFVLNCDIGEPDTAAVERGVISFRRIREYWYDTGPKHIFDHHVRFVGNDEVAPVDDKEVAKDVVYQRHHYTLLIKREGELNPWHCLLEIWSMAMSLDVLRSTRNQADHFLRPHYLFPEDMTNMQVVVVDDREDGPYFDLWKLFSGRKPLRLKEIASDPQAMAFYNTSSSPVATQHHMIVPLAGGSNPVWQNDWAVRDCTQSDTLRVFARRVLNHYNIDNGMLSDPKEPADNPTPIRVTFIDRKDANTRRLTDQDGFLEAVRTKYNGTVVVDAVDFGSLSFAEQLKIARATDVLVGVHGAGLTHIMFLKEHTTAVVEIQPADMDATFMGFRNLANMRGINYFRTTAAPVNETETSPPAEPTKEEGEVGDKQARGLERRASWHRENFAMDKDVFVRVVGAAIESVYNKGVHHFEVK